jgi:hypothetical protein
VIAAAIAQSRCVARGTSREITTWMSIDTLCLVAVEELVTVTGGGALGRLFGIGNGANDMDPRPSDFVGMIDKPAKTLDLARNALGIPRSGNPGDNYSPAQLGGDGSITGGGFSAPSSGPSVPISE